MGRPLPSNTTEKGSLAEDHALFYLEKQGLKLISRNYRAKSGEVDLIMQDQEDVVFIEVKFRQNEDQLSILETVPKWKQSRVIRAATLFLLEKQWFDQVYVRFDVLGLIGENFEEMTWIKNAFAVD